MSMIEDITLWVYVYFGENKSQLMIIKFMIYFTA